jgi:basic amino acid/polyamine antiporter, APA family
MAELDVGSRQASGAPIFVRKATGLVRGWAMVDGSIYAFYSCNIVLGLWVLTFGSFIPNGSLFWAVLICAALTIFQILTYAGLISAMPRAGGDYVWQSRILTGGIGFVLAVTGWWFILWHWVPIYANITVISVFEPLLTILGAHTLAADLTTKTGVFVSSLIVIGFTWAYISVGMKSYARLQRISFVAGGLAFAVFVILMLVSSHSSFVSAFNREAHSLYGTHGNTYQATLKTSGYNAHSLLYFNPKETFLMIGFIAFYLIYPNWGATLAGEVRGANDMKKNVRAMSAALVMVTIISLIFLALFSKTFGWQFYNAVNAGYGGGLGKGPLGAYPFPIMLGGWLVSSHVFQFILIALFSLWIFGWYGTVFLSSTRVIFAAAFDRILPEWAAYVSPTRRVPVAALMLMVIPSIGVAALYAYWGNFATYTLDAGLVIVVTYLGTSFAAMIMPWRMKRVYENSAVARYRLFGIPAISIVGFGSFAFMAYLLILWLSNGVFGVNNTDSLIYMGILYALALVIYVVAKVVRGRQGMRLEEAMHEIPAE